MLLGISPELIRFSSAIRQMEVFPQQLKALGSQPRGSGVVRGGPEARFHQGSTRVPPGFHQGFTRVPSGFHEVLRGLRGGASAKKSTACCWGFHLSLFLKMSPLFPQELKALGLSPEVVRGGQVPRGFHQGSTEVPPGSARAGWVV